MICLFPRYAVFIKYTPILKLPKFLLDGWSIFINSANHLGQIEKRVHDLYMGSPKTLRTVIGGLPMDRFVTTPADPLYGRPLNIERVVLLRSSSLMYWDDSANVLFR